MTVDTGFTKSSNTRTAGSTIVAGRDVLALVDADGFDTLPGFVPKEGCVYTVTRAISARINQNFDGFPSSELKQSYKTFLGKPLFVNHANEDPEKARGRVVGARYVETGLDKYIQVLQEVEARKYPLLAKELEDGGLDSVSMGCVAAVTVCSACGNEATDMFDMCSHILGQKGQTIQVREASGGFRDQLVYEECRGLGFFELSYVFDPADETAVISNVITADRDSHIVARESGNRVRCDMSGCKRWTGISSAKRENWVQRQAAETVYDFCSDSHRSTFEAANPNWKHANLSKKAFGEVEAPTPVDTLREEEDEDSYHQYVASPPELSDPDLEKNKEIDRVDDADAEDPREDADESDDKKESAMNKTARRKTADVDKIAGRWIPGEGAMGEELVTEDFKYVLNVSSGGTSRTPGGFDDGPGADSYHQEWHWTVMDESTGQTVASGTVGGVDAAKSAAEAAAVSLGSRVAQRKTAAIGYICKQCGGPSPMGVGYAADGEAAQRASEGLKSCSCGHSVAPSTARRKTATGFCHYHDGGFPDVNACDCNRSVDDVDPGKRWSSRTKTAAQWGRRDGILEYTVNGVTGYVYDDLNNGNIEWSVEKDQQILSEGQSNTVEQAKSAVEQYLDSNHTSSRTKAAGIQWSEERTDGGKQFNYEPGGQYSVHVYQVHDPFGGDPNTDYYGWWVWDYAANDDTVSHDNIVKPLAEALEDAEAAFLALPRNFSASTGNRPTSVQEEMKRRPTGGNTMGRTRQADQSRNDQGEQEEAFITQTPPAEPVETGEGEDITNTPNNLVAFKAFRRYVARQGIDLEALTPVQIRAQAKAFAKSAKISVASLYPHLGQELEAARVAAAAFKRASDDDEGPKGDKASESDKDKAKDDDDKKEARRQFMEARRRRQAEKPDFLKDKEDDDDDDKDSKKKESGRTRRAGELPDALKENAEKKKDEAKDDDKKKESTRRVRRRQADSSLEVAAPDGRVDVERPTADTTDDDAQESQFDKGDFGDNAGDDLAKPDLSTDQNWAPGDGKKSGATIKASASQAVRLAELHIDLGIDKAADKWKLVDQFEATTRPTVLDRIALLERVAAAHQNTRTAGSTRGSSVKSNVPPSLGAQRQASTSHVAAEGDPSRDFEMFL